MTARHTRTSRLGRLRDALAGRRVADDEGMALVAIILVATVLSIIAGVIIVDSTAELRRATAQVDKTSALQAAQGGLDEYTSKLAEDNGFQYHYVHRAEPIRISALQSTGSAGTYAWHGGPTWTYDPHRRWVPLGTSGFEYSLEVVPPTDEVNSPDRTLRIVSTGRKAGDTNVANWRTIETRGRGSSVADFQTVVNGNLTLDDYMVTKGPIYASGEIDHHGTAYADLYAEKQVKIDPSHLIAPAQEFDPTTTPSIRTEIPVPVDFSTFTTAVSTISAVANTVPPGGTTPQGIVLNDTSVQSWELVFHTGPTKGLIDIYQCPKVHENDQTLPTCTLYQQDAQVPDIGTIYVGQDLIVRGVVQGQVTVASATDIYIGGDLTYKTPGDDILGLIAGGDLIVAAFAYPPSYPGDTRTSLTWYAATVSQTGLWREGTTASGFDAGNFNGSIAASENGGNVTPTFKGTHTYNYDPTLIYLQPPFFPTIGIAYRMLVYREVTPYDPPRPQANP